MLAAIATGKPADSEGRCGFEPEREERLADMLMFRDVHGDRR